MKLNAMVRASMLGLAVLVSSLTAQALETKRYVSEKYKFSILFPKDAKIEEASHGPWGGAHASYEGVHVFAISKLGVQADPEDIEAFGKKLSETDKAQWTALGGEKTDEGKHWWKASKATHGDVIVLAVYGTRPQGSYLSFVKASKSDVEKHQAEFTECLKSMKLE